MPHGVVKNAYVAKKRDVNGNYFGFVRLEGVGDVENTLQGMNGVKIFKAKLSVSLAKFDKEHNKFKQQWQLRSYPPINKNTKPRPITIRNPTNVTLGVPLNAHQ
ncbi:putative nucleotide-binding alpha-beta plait domain superfamily, RNA-binding domain superfamily [Helianthus anomalus]